MIGAAIKNYLNQNGIKQAFVADKVGITPGQMSDICNKERTIDCVLYYKICRVLNVSLDLFFEGLDV